MYDPSMRVLTVLEMLQAREQVTGRELAERLEVSPRTVQRYVARLQDLGVPVAATRGPGGAYRLRPGFRLPPMMFGVEEAFALALGLDALANLGLEQIAPAAVGARAKLDRVMPTAIRERVEGVRSALLLERGRIVAPADAARVIELAGAAYGRRRVRLRYESGGGSVTEREVEPFGLAQHEGRWFMAGNCLLRGGPRLFRVDRIRAVDLLETGFVPPEEFDLRGFVHERLALHAAPWDIDVWLGIAPGVAEARLPRAFAELTPEGEGTRVRCTATVLTEIALLLLQCDCAVLVRRPVELREAFRAVSTRALTAAAS